MMQNRKTVLWSNNDNTSLEYAALYSCSDRFSIEGTVILLLEGFPTVILYILECDSLWRTRQVTVTQDHAGKTSKLTLTVNNNQRWQENQNTLPFANGLFDVDFEISPLTNVLPIRRLSLKIGESLETTAVWIRFPSLKLEPLKQRYTRISERFYRYEAPELAFEAQLEVDETGLMVRYGNLWMRIA